MNSSYIIRRDDLSRSFDSMEKFMKETTLSDIKVMCVIAENMNMIRKAFRQLEEHLPSLKGRKFYGTYLRGIYKACVAIRERDNPSALGLDTDIIPGGKYVSEKMNNWGSHIPEIKERFMAMAGESNYDDSRPSIEFYRSMRELILYSPIK
jgi:hypothetical protein